MIPFSNGWEFAPQWTEAFARGEGPAEAVRLPHTVKELPLHQVDEKSYQMISGYRKRFTLPEGKRFFLQLDGAAHIATVYVNGKELGTHPTGYTAFRVEFTDAAVPGENLVAVKLDSTENPAVPPFGFVIDYLTYGGLYRPAWLEAKGENMISDVFVQTPDLHTAQVAVTLDQKAAKDDTVIVRILDKDGKALAETAGSAARELRLDVPDAQPWDLEHPNLYTCEVSLRDEDVKRVPFGFRTVEFKADGCYLNGKRTYLRGLNRHQSYPYVGYAASDSLQVEDARMLKEELGCTAVRTSHYPQSQAFIDACDRLGLLVFTEFPGWQHIGDESWKLQAIQNVKEMVLQYRNHPSIVLWGVRINESLDDDEFYLRTNATAHALDPSRPTSGVRYLQKSSLLEDVYAFNDFSHTGDNPGALPKAEVTPDMSKAFLISENNGHMFPTKSFDNWARRQEHALRHARVHNDALADGQHAGCFSWCMFDYPTHKDFGSGDRICYHGVMDAFRNPKLAAAFYASQQDETPVLEIGSSMDIGDYPASVIGDVWLFTNADSVKLYKNDQFVAEFSDTPFKNLPHGPMPMQAETFLSGWGDRVTEWRFDAIRNGQVVKSVIRAANSELKLEVIPSSTTLTEGDTYDMAAVRIRIVDKWGHTAPFVQLPLLFEVTGAAELVGPAVITAEGGMGGTYIRTAGEAGKAVLTIRCPGLKTLQIAFDVIK